MVFIIYAHDRIGNMKATLNRKLCIGCNLCVEVAPEVFFMKGEKSAVKNNPDLSTKEIREKAKLAMQACPVQAISVEE